MSSSGRAFSRPTKNREPSSQVNLESPSSSPSSSKRQSQTYAGCHLRSGRKAAACGMKTRSQTTPKPLNTVRLPPVVSHKPRPRPETRKKATVDDLGRPKKPPTAFFFFMYVCTRLSLDLELSICIFGTEPGTVELATALLRKKQLGCGVRDFFSPELATCNWLRMFP